MNHRIRNKIEAAYLRKRLPSTLTIQRQDGSMLTLKGKICQVLKALIDYRKTGCIGLDFSRATTAFRYANHLCDLRKLNIDILTTRELAGDSYIGRYWLKENLTIIDGAKPC